MFRLFFLIFIRAILGSASVATFVPLNANADGDLVDLVAIPVSDALEISPESIIPWSSEDTDIESQISFDESIIYIVADDVGTPTPSEMADLHRVSSRSYKKLAHIIAAIFTAVVVISLYYLV